MFDAMTDEQFTCWFAGFFDGEGCIYLPAKTGIALTVANTHRPVIAAIHARLGFGVMTTITFSNPRWRTKYTWETKRGDQAGPLLRRLRPFLTIKAAKADAALARIEASDARRRAREDRNRRIIEAVLAGKTHADVGAMFGMPRHSVTSLMSYFRKRGRLEFLDRPEGVSERAYRDKSHRLTPPTPTRQTARS